MNDFVFESLGNHHDRLHFDCGVGRLLLSDAISPRVCVAGEIAASLIIVDSKGDAATRFYEKFGFISLPKLSDRMFVPMQTAEKL